jgi:integrase
MAGKLTTRQIDSEPAPGKGAITLWDGEVKGFGARIFAPSKRHPKGARSFFLNYRFDGVERRYTIGSRPEWSVEAARDEAKEQRRLVNQNKDPTVDKRERREAPTIQDLVDRYEREVIPTRRLDNKARLNDEKRILALISGCLGKYTKVADIHGGDIEAMHKRLTTERGAVRANRILAVASKAFARALVPLAGERKPWRDAAQGNPCKGIQRNHEEAAGRLYSPAELAAISDALAEYKGSISADCVRLIMLTGCRPGEAMKARWEEFDRELGYWIKPSAHTKQKKEHRLPLAAPALALIEQLRAKRGGGAAWVFPSDRPDEPITALWHVWHFIRERASLPADARLYDLRHSYASTGAGSGLSLPIIGKLLGHTTARTTQRYAAHLADDPLKAAVNKIGAVISGAGQPSAKLFTVKG